MNRYAGDPAKADELMTKIRSLENRLLTKGLGDDGSRLLTIYLATLVCPISMPSLSNSPWIRGAPHSGLAMLISQISLRISGGIVGHHDVSTSSANTLSNPRDANG